MNDILDDRLTYTLTYINFRCNLGSLAEVPDKTVARFLAADLDVADLDRGLRLPISKLIELR